MGTTYYWRCEPRCLGPVVSARSHHCEVTTFPLHAPFFKSESQNPVQTHGEGIEAVLPGRRSVAVLQTRVTTTTVTGNWGNTCLGKRYTTRQTLHNSFHVLCVSAEAMNTATFQWRIFISLIPSTFYLEFHLGKICPFPCTYLFSLTKL